MKLLLYLFVLASWSSQAQPTKTNAKEPKQVSKGYVLQKQEGEVLNDPRGRKMIIKVSPESGAAHLSMGATEMPKGREFLSIVMSTLRRYYLCIEETALP